MTGCIILERGNKLNFFILIYLTVHINFLMYRREFSSYLPIPNILYNSADHIILLTIQNNISVMTQLIFNCRFILLTEIIYNRFSLKFIKYIKH